MINTYNDFLERIEYTIKLRSKNYVNTDCGLENLTRVIYSDIMTKINLGYIKDGYLMDGSQSFAIRGTNENLDTPSDPNGAATEHYKVPTDIVDDKDYTISRLLQHVDNFTYRWTTEEAASNFDGRYIYFVRAIHYEIESLPGHLYQDIYNAMIEGIMYEISTSIPSQVDDLVSNRYYQRYYNERTDLINRFPQVQYVEENIPARRTELWQS